MDDISFKALRLFFCSIPGSTSGTVVGSFLTSFLSSQITIEAMKSDIDEVALQGIEFWSNVCDEEMDLAIEASEVCVSRLSSVDTLRPPG